MVVALTAVSAWQHVNGPWGSFLAFLAVTVALALVSVQVYDRGAFSFAGAGMLAIGFSFGIGAAVIVGALMGIINLVRRRGRLNRGIFDSSQWALAAGTGAAVYQAFGDHHSTWARLGPAVAAGLAFFAVNLGLLTFAMSLAEGVSPVADLPRALPLDRPVPPQLGAARARAHHRLREDGRGRPVRVRGPAGVHDVLDPAVPREDAPARSKRSARPTRSSRRQTPISATCSSSRLG